MVYGANVSYLFYAFSVLDEIGYLRVLFFSINGSLFMEDGNHQDCIFT